MPAFDVTTNPTKLDRPLKPGDQATIVVTATNRLPRPVTGCANAVVVPPGSFDSYIQPKNAQRMFNQAGSTQEFPFTVAIPAAATAASFNVRFDIVDIDHQDDNFGQSSLLKVTVEGSGIIPPPPPKRRWWLWVAIATAAIVVLGLLIWLLVRPKSVAKTETCTPTYARQGTAPGTGEIVLLSGAPDARGARVYLNEVCQDYMLSRESGAILLLAQVPPGGYRISVRKDGYQNLERDITVVGGQRVSVDFDLRR